MIGNDLENGLSEEAAEERLPERPVGRVSHFYNKAGVAAVELEDELELGEMIHFLGKNTDFDEEVTSLERDNKKIVKAHPGESVGIKVTHRVHKGDEVYKRAGKTLEEESAIGYGGEPEDIEDELERQREEGKEI